MFYEYNGEKYTYPQGKQLISNIEKTNDVLEKQLQGYNAWKNRKENMLVPDDDKWNEFDDETKNKRVDYRIKSTTQKIEKNKEAVVEIENKIIKPFEKLKKELGGPKVHAVVNAKGGVGKTTLTSSIGYTLSELGFKVLLIDSDSQASLSQLCNVYYDVGVQDIIIGLQNIYHYYLNGGKDDQRIFDAAICTPKYGIPTGERNEKGEMVYDEYPFGFDLIPADIELSKVEIDVTKKVSKHGAYLYAIIQRLLSVRDYDFILIDCPPALTNLSYMGIAAATDGVIVPINLNMMTIRSTRNLIDAVAEIQTAFHKSTPPTPHKGVLGLIKSEYTKNRRVTRSLDNIVEDFFPIHSFKTVIPTRSAAPTSELDGILFSQVPAIQKEGFFYDLVGEIVAEDIKRKGEKNPQVVEKVKLDERGIRNGSY